MATFELTSSGIGGFGSDTTVQLPNSAATLVDALRLYLTLATNTAGSEIALWLVQLVTGGALTDAFAFGFQNNTLTTFYFGPVANNNSIRCSATTLQLARGGTQLELSSTGILCDVRISESRATASVSTNTLTLTTQGNLNTVPGTPTINGVVTSGVRDGYSGRLRIASGTTIVHNSGAPGAGAVAILTPTQANIVATSTRVVPISYDGTNFIVDG